MSELPLVSILLLSMNHEQYITQCINSIAAQSYKNIEVIYLDNASTDNTYATGVSLLKKSGIPYKHFSNSVSQGISKNFNFLFHNSSGVYVMPLSTDDWLTADSVELKINYFKQNSNVGLVYSSCYFHYYDTGNTIVTPKKNIYKSGYILTDLLKEYCISTIGYIIKSDCLKEVGEFDEQSLFEDRDIAIRIAEKFSIGYIDKELAYYGRQETGNITLNYKYMLKGQEYIVSKFSHYKEIKYAKEQLLVQKVYCYATYEPSFETLVFIFKNFKPNIFFVKQIIKTIKNIIVK